MSKLLSLKPWLSLQEAAGYLQSIFNEEVSVADVLRFCLSGNLVLSANFVNHGRARIAERALIVDTGFSLIPSLIQENPPKVTLSIGADAIPAFEAWMEANPSAAIAIAERKQSIFVCLQGDQISPTECITRGGEVVSIEGIWDLSMIGAERLDIEHRLQQETNGVPIELVCLDGVLLMKEDGTYARLQAKFDEDDRPPVTPGATSAPDVLRKSRSSDYYPAGSLPPDAPLVVRPAALLALVARVDQSFTAGKPFASRERNNLLRIILALNYMAKLPDRGAASSVALQLEQLGFDGPGEETIRKVIAEARELKP